MPKPRGTSSGRSSSRIVLSVVLLGILLLGSTTRSDAQKSTDADPSSVELVLVGDFGGDPAFARRVTSWFDPARYEVRVRAVEQLPASSILSVPRDGTIHVWAMLRDAHHARLYFAAVLSPEGDAAYLLRDLELTGGLDEVGAENLAQVIHLSTIALLQGKADTRREEVERVLREEPTVEPGVSATSRASSPPSVAPPRVDSSAPRGSKPKARFRLELAVGYEVSPRGDEGFWHGPRVGWGGHAASGWGFEVSVQSSLPTRQRMATLELDLIGGRGGIAGTFRRSLRPAVSVEGLAGVGVEVVRWESARSLDPTIAAGGREIEARLGLVIGVQAFLGRRAPRLGLGAQALVPLERTHYDVITGTARRVVGRAAPVLPLLGAEVRF